MNDVSIRLHGGAPCLHVDGAPHNGLAFWHGSTEKGVAEWQLFARCGVNLLQVNLSLWPDAAGSADPAAAWNRTAGLVSGANPAARFWIRLQVEPPAWWPEQHPDEAQVHLDEKCGDRFIWWVAFAAPRWRAEAAARLQRFVAHMEERWHGQIWVYQPMAGDCGEWAYSWKPVLSGYAPAQVTAWREWLRARYGDEVSLREAWGLSNAGFDTAEPPQQERTLKSGWPPASQVIDPSAERRVVDWLAFHGSAQSSALAELAASVRQTLVALGRRKLIAAFHGYHFFAYGAAYGPCNAGFSDLDPVLRSPDVDILCTPLSNIHRGPGGLYSHHVLSTPIRLHGKLYYLEDDTFTHRAAWTPWRYCCKSAPETLAILRRNLVAAFAEGAGLWWMDHDSAGWYLDDTLESGISQMRRLADAALETDRRSVAEIVFVSNETSFRLLRQDSALIDLLWLKTQTELLRIGAPVDSVRVHDMALAEAAGDAARWKFVVVAGCFWLDAGERALLRQVLMHAGRHLLFLHGQGISDGTRLGPVLTAELTGIGIRAYPHGGVCRAETVLDGGHLAWGTDKEVSPILHVEDAGAEPLGWLERQYCPVFARKRQDGWTSLWSGVPGLPWSLLGRLAEAAGVHRYLTDGSQVMANGGMLAVHAIGDGPLTVRLPQPRLVRDAIGGHDLGTADCIRADACRGDTRLWHLADA